jgi:hypothetical protein
MGQTNLAVYHTQFYSVPSLTFPKLATGYEQWLGDGFYFWQDEYFARWWGESKKTNPTNPRFIIYLATLEFDSDDFIDTVFNEEDYYEFCKNVEKFAQKCQKNLGRKPSLSEFNEFLDAYKLWDNICVIRFQDLPESNLHLEVEGFYYKKRIQIRVKKPEIITKFVLYKNLARV